MLSKSVIISRKSSGFLATKLVNDFLPVSKRLGDPSSTERGSGY